MTPKINEWLKQQHPSDSPCPGDQCDAGIRGPGEDIHHDDHEGDLRQLPLASDGLLLDEGGFPDLSPQTLYLPVGAAGRKGRLKLDH